MAEELKACPFCGGDANAAPESQHYPGCYFDVLASLRAAKGGDISLVPEVLRAWNRRAQPPSQGGEAVAWRVTGRDGLTVTAQYPEWAEADCLLTVTPLYTHPADQVADGVVVPIGILRVACGGGNEAWQALEEIRTLLARREGMKP